MVSLLCLNTAGFNPLRGEDFDRKSAPFYVRLAPAASAIPRQTPAGRHARLGKKVSRLCNTRRDERRKINSWNAALDVINLL
jgi:hypothetical protein